MSCSDYNYSTMDNEWLGDESSTTNLCNSSKEDTLVLNTKSQKLSTSEVLCNMASMLASVGAGYDLRLSNISPVHPKLISEREERIHQRHWPSDSGRPYYNSEYEYSSGLSNYARNTYHGPVKHYRPALADAIDFKPLRSTDSPQHNVSLKNHNPRRKTSNAGIEESSYPPPPAPSGGFTAYSSTDSSCRSDYYRSPEHHPGYQYQSNEYAYGDEPYHSYVYEVTNNNGIRSQRIQTHRRTPSNSSSNVGMNNTNPGYTNDGDEGAEIMYSPFTRRGGDYSGYFSRQNSVESSSGERPSFLDIGTTKLRSSLKKTNYLAPALRSQNTGGSSSSGPGSPTNPTPPDSLTSEDSSYMSAKDSSSNSISRVRFSPNTIMDMPCHSHSQESSIRRPYSRESSRTRRPSYTDYDRDYLS